VFLWGLKQSPFLIDYDICTQWESDERTPGGHKRDEFRSELPLVSVDLSAMPGRVVLVFDASRDGPDELLAASSD
jgi:hypothetical protein